jgi:deazaflavin-dependent oxidoreductase (nitroreductase family)
MGAFAADDRPDRPVIAVPRPNAAQRASQRLAALRPVAFVFRHTFHHVDAVWDKVFPGRTLSSIIAGLPNILLTTTGARTGRARTVPLIGLPADGGIAVVGTRFGSQSHPGWYHNLLQEPRCVVAVGRTRIDATARLLPPGPEYDAVMATADTVYAGFAHYRRRITDRRIPVFVLTPHHQDDEPSVATDAQDDEGSGLSP